MSDVPTGDAGGLRRLMQAYFDRRYAILFYSLLLTIAAGPLFGALGPEADLLEWLLALNVLAAVIPIGAGRGRQLLLTVVVTAWAVRQGATWLGQPTIATTGLAIWTGVALLAAAQALRFALRATTVDREHLYAALAAYVLFGIFLGAFYWVLELVWPRSFVMTREGLDGDFLLSHAIYFSFVTLTTLGYGDIVPRSEVARGLATVEAVTGQLYLAVMIAHLVSLYVREGSEGKPSSWKDPEPQS